MVGGGGAGVRCVLMHVEAQVEAPPPPPLLLPPPAQHSVDHSRRGPPLLRMLRMLSIPHYGLARLLGLGQQVVDLV